MSTRCQRCAPPKMPVPHAAAFRVAGVLARILMTARTADLFAPRAAAQVVLQAAEHGKGTHRTAKGTPEQRRRR